jgi:hypothetical protein
MFTWWKCRWQVLNKQSFEAAQALTQKAGWSRVGW